MQRSAQLFPLWVIAFGAAALAVPELFVWFSGDLITYSLALIMLMMGLTLTPEDFARVTEMPRLVLLGAALQFTVMPALGWSLGRALGLSEPLAAGLILVACCPGGTASNIVAWIARADIALSVTMTTVSTMLAVALTPLLTTALIGDRLEVDGWGLFFGAVRVVLVPVLLGLLLRRYAPRLSHMVLPVAPLLAVLLVAMIVAAILASGRNALLSSGPELFAAIILLHALGFALGYGLSRLARSGEKAARTISIEVGMQNSGLGAELARNNFAANIATVAALPAALSALTHSVIGSIIAAWWLRKDGPSSEEREHGN